MNSNVQQQANFLILNPQLFKKDDDVSVAVGVWQLVLQRESQPLEFGCHFTRTSVKTYYR